MSQDRELSLIDCESPLQGKLARRVRRGQGASNRPALPNKWRNPMPFVAWPEKAIDAETVQS